MPRTVTCHCGTKVEAKDNAPERRVNCPTCGSVIFLIDPDAGGETETYAIADVAEAGAGGESASGDDHDAPSTESAPGWLDRYKLSPESRKPDTEKMLSLILKAGAANPPNDPYAAALYQALMQPAADATVASLAKIAASGHPVYGPIATTMLGHLGPSEANGAQQVLNMLHEAQSPAMGELLTACLLRIGPTPVVHVRSLVFVLGANKSPAVGKWAAECLRLIGPPARNAVDALLKSLKVSDQGLRLTAIDALGAIAREPEHVIPILLQALKLKDPKYRAHAAAALGRFGASAAPAGESLKAALADDDLMVRQAANEAIAAIAGAGTQAPAAAQAPGPAGSAAAEPIFVTCQCGGRLRIKPQLAGRKVKCPACSGTLTVPRPSPSLDEKVCPSCLATVPSGVVLCVHCGLDFRTGKRINLGSAPVAAATPAAPG